MSDFWPYDLDLKDLTSPFDILKTAKQQWSVESGGLLDLIIQEAESTSGHTMLIVHAKHVPSNRTATLFSVVHRSGAAYPARIQPRDNELPDLLKKSYYREGFAGLADLGGIGARPGREITNKWVCDTPSEFREKLIEVFSLGMVKSEIISLVSGNGLSQESEEEPQRIEESSDRTNDDLDQQDKT